MYQHVHFALICVVLYGCSPSPCRTVSMLAFARIPRSNILARRASDPAVAESFISRRGVICNSRHLHSALGHNLTNPRRRTVVSYTAALYCLRSNEVENINIPGHFSIRDSISVLHCQKHWCEVAGVARILRAEYSLFSRSRYSRWDQMLEHVSGLECLDSVRLPSC